MSLKEDQTFDLIKTLSKSEISFFKKYAKFQSNKVKPEYLSLFDKLLKMKVYDEKKLIDKSYSKNLTYTKNYLFNQIIESLKFSYTDNSIDNKINKLIRESTILTQKGLDKLAKKRLKKAKELSIEEENNIQLYKIIDFIRKLSVFKSKEHKTECLNTFFMESKNALNAEMKSLNYKELHSRLSMLYYEKRINEKTKLNEEIKDILENHPLIKNKENLESKAYYYRNFIISYAYILLGQKEKSLKYQKIGLEERINNKSYITTPFQFTTSLSTILSTILDLKRYSEFKEYAEYFKLIQKKNKNDEIHKFVSETVFYMRYYACTFNSLDGIKHINNTKKDFTKFKTLISTRRKAEITYSFGLIYLIDQDYNKSSSYFNTIENNKENSIYLDILIVSKILNSFCHLELNNNIYLDNYLKKLKAFFKINNLNTEFETFIYKKLIEMNKKKNHNLIKSYYFDMYEEMKSKKNEADTIKIQEYFDFEQWFLKMSK